MDFVKIGGVKKLWEKAGISSKARVFSSLANNI